MKKGIISLLVLTLIVIFLAACTNNSQGSNENSMILHITNNADFEFDGVEISTDNISSGISNADETSIQKGSTLQVEYMDQKDFPLAGDASFEFAIRDKEGKKISLQEITLELSTNKNYHFEIVGDSPAEAEIQRLG